MLIPINILFCIFDICLVIGIGFLVFIINSLYEVENE